MTKTLALLCALAAAAPALRAETPAETVQKFAKPLASESLDERQAARDAIQSAGAQASKPGAEPERVAYAKAVLGFLAPSNPQPARVWFVRMLGLFGADEAVAPLAGLLSDSDTELRDAARRALQASPSPKAADALRGALGTSKDPLAARGLMDALANRADAGSVDTIAKRLADSDAAVASAAALALGKIGDARAVAALVTARARAAAPLKGAIERGIVDAKAADARSLGELCDTATDAAVRCAALARLLETDPAGGKGRIAAAIKDKDAKVAAAALWLALGSKDASLKKSALDAIPSLPPALQASAAGILGETRDPQGVGHLKQLVKSADEAVRITAVAALGRCAGAEALDTLLERLAAGGKDEQAAAERALAVLRDPAADARMMQIAKKGSDPLALAAIRAAAARNPAGAPAALMELAKSTDPAVRDAALEGLKSIGTTTELNPLLDIVATSPDARARGKAQAAAGAIASRAPDPAPALDAIRQAMARTASPANKAELVAMLSTVPGPAAIDETVKAFADADASVRDASLRALSSWPDFAAGAPLLKIARDTTPDNKHHVLAMRGIAKILGIETAPGKDRVALAKDALAAARRPDEKKLIIAALGNVKDGQARKLLEELAKDADVGNEAAAALAKSKK